MNLIIISLAIFSCVSLITSILCTLKVLSLWVEIESFKKSTHSVQFVGASTDEITISEKLQKESSDALKEAYPEFAQSLGADDNLGLKGL